jgi:hypothetical protein
LVAIWILAVPQLFLLLAAGAGLVLAGRRWYMRERARIEAELEAAEEALARRAERPIVRLEADPLTGIYRPKRLH